MRKEVNLTEEQVERLKNIFNSKNWGGDSYDAFLERLSFLKNSEYVNLILDLTEDYLIIEQSEYLNYLKQVFTKFIADKEEKLNEMKTIYFCPLKPKADETKSSSFVWYLMNSVFSEVLKKYSQEMKKKFKLKDYSNKLLTRESPDEQLAFVFLDDYIGSGQTAKEQYDLLQNDISSINGNDENNFCNIYYLCFAIQNEGEQLIINDLKCEVHYIEKRLKGITENDKYNSEEINKKISLMKEISKILNEKRNPLGYKDSEGLITLIKTPNNTFPFYWKKHKRSEPPFFRHI